MLTPEVEEVWGFLQARPELAGFILIGGTALAFRIHHRLSEDIDLAFPDVRLPVARLNALFAHASSAGLPMRRNDDPAALEEFAIAGMDLLDYQQDLVASNGVKVSFFTPDAGAVKLVAGNLAGPVRIASLPEIFGLKALLSADRSRTRDWFDLYVLMRDHGFTVRDFRGAFEKAGELEKIDCAFQRLCSGVPHSSDEGYQSLLAAPPTLEEMRDYFIAARAQYEAERATEIFQNRPK